MDSDDDEDAIFTDLDDDSSALSSIEEFSTSSEVSESDEELVSDDRVDPAPPPVIHSITTCDECGVYPIVGVRYKSTAIYDYDCCELCCLHHHSEVDRNNNFHAFLTETAMWETRLVAPRNRNSISASTVTVAESQLVSGERMAPNASFRIGRFTSSEECHRITNFVNQNRHLNLIRITIDDKSSTFSSDDSEDGVPITCSEEQAGIVASGLASNTSIRVLTWDSPYLKPILRVLSTQNGLTALQALALVDGKGDRATNKTQSLLLDVLRTNKTLKTVSLPQHTTNEMNEIHPKVQTAVMSNPKLFHVRYNANNHHKEENRVLDTLTSINRYLWMSRWNGTEKNNEDAAVAKSSSPSSEKRIRVLEEISTHFQGKKEETATAVFLLFQNLPPTCSV